MPDRGGHGGPPVQGVSLLRAAPRKVDTFDRFYVKMTGDRLGNEPRNAQPDYGGTISTTEHLTCHLRISRRSVAVFCSSIMCMTLLSVNTSRARGGLDFGFGDGGVVVTNLNGSDFAFAIALQSDGKIVTAGTSAFGFMLVRYNSDGTLDPSFGAGGTVLKYFGPYNLAYSVAIQPDGKILAAGYHQNSASGSPDFEVTPIVARFNP